MGGIGNVPKLLAALILAAVVAAGLLVYGRFGDLLRALESLRLWVLEPVVLLA
jgi:hypothetical protein